MQAESPAAEFPLVWIGIDVAKATVDAALYPPPAGALLSPVQNFPRTAAGMADLLAWARKNAGPDEIRFRAVMEATGRYSIEAFAWLIEADPALKPAIVNPQQACYFAKSHLLRNKTDEADARMLALYGAERTPEPYEPLAPAYLELRALTRERGAVIEEHTRIGNRTGEGTDSTFVAKTRAKLQKTLEKAIAGLEREIARVVAANPELAKDVRRLLTIPGVGIVTATTLLAELGDLRRFDTGRELAAFAGVSPRRCESGTSVRGRTRMCKQGPAPVRAVLYMSAMSSSWMENGMKEVFERLVERGKPKKSALGALMRKQLLLARTLLVKGEDYTRRTAEAGGKTRGEIVPENT